MSEYTPTTADIREWWAEDQNRTHGEGDGAHAEEFNRWLTKVVADAKAEAWEVGLNVGIGYGVVMNLPGIPEPVNPYTPADPDESHDFDPAPTDPLATGCARCAALPGEGEACEPPVKWEPTSPRFDTTKEAHEWLATPNERGEER
ncbi:hypothetical protein [Glaciibacter psychrotolerans]|uniref:Uncharacterized protein n=1 Tax=Glaciibacter psychrotolerans TaxID=670054 RepID=A0A7Z0ECM4_9MICO|nr:hypothetical protein [Leifsonia psychrotolerans]NYJ19181.1 hypothetical protein [Leifsonia psychrotolerans]